MKRLALTNFVLWAIPGLAFGLMLAWDVVVFAFIGLCVLAVAWWTRFWPEALGVAAGMSGASLLAGLWTSGTNAGVTPYFIAAAVLFAVTWVTWRVRRAAHVAVHEADGPTARPNGTSRRWGLILGVVVSAAALLVVNVILGVGYWFGHCGTDTSPPPPPGSEVERYCDLLKGGSLSDLLLLGPSLLVLGVGVAMALLRRGELALLATLVGIGLTIAIHVPGWVVPAGG
jgi:hypothetical protein